jgi:hypothetical protein
MFCTCRLLSESLSLTFKINKQCSVSLSAHLKDRIWRILECHLLSIRDQIVSLPIRRGPGVFIHQERTRCIYMFQCGNAVLLTTRYWDVASFTTLTPSSLLSASKFSFPSFRKTSAPVNLFFSFNVYILYRKQLA